MVKHVPFKNYNMGSNPVGLNGYRLMVDQSSSTRFVSIRFRLTVDNYNPFQINNSRGLYLVT